MGRGGIPSLVKTCVSSLSLAHCVRGACTPVPDTLEERIALKSPPMIHRELVAVLNSLIFVEMYVCMNSRGVTCCRCLRRCVCTLSHRLPVVVEEVPVEPGQYVDSMRMSVDPM